MIRRVEICGGIASGKTTLTTLIQRLSLIPIFEDFEKNPFWIDFYRDPVASAFETEIAFLLQHYHAVKAAAAGSVCCDFSFELDVAYADSTMNIRERGTFGVVHQHVLEELGPPRLLIFLRCAPEIELSRIKSRGRAAEMGVSVDYLKGLNLQIQRRIQNMAYSCHCLEIDSGICDFANNTDDIDETLHKVEHALKASISS